MRRLPPALLVLSLTACGAGAGAGVAADPGAAAAVAAFECPATAGPGGEPVELDGRRLRVVTTVAPLTSMVADVAGPFAEVAGLVPEGHDSHTFEPKPSAAVALAEADVVFLNGLDLEEPTRDLARRRLADGARLVELGDETLAPGQYLFDRSFPRDGGSPNPHLWTNPPMAACYATVVGRVLAAADPGNADAYTANAAALAVSLEALDDAFAVASATVPAPHRVLLTYHDAYAYLAANHGWRVLGAVQPSSFDEPTPRDIARIVEQVRETGVPAIFGSEVFPSPVLERIGEEAEVRYVDVLRDDDLPGEPGDPGHSLLGLLRFDLVTIVESLGGDASALGAVGVVDP